LAVAWAFGVDWEFALLAAACGLDVALACGAFVGDIAAGVA
jgi:hypothetical protein